MNPDERRFTWRRWESRIKITIEADQALFTSEHLVSFSPPPLARYPPALTRAPTQAVAPSPLSDQPAVK